MKDKVMVSIEAIKSHFVLGKRAVDFIRCKDQRVIHLMAIHPLVNLNRCTYSVQRPCNSSSFKSLARLKVERELETILNVSSSAIQRNGN